MIGVESLCVVCHRCSPVPDLPDMYMLNKERGIKVEDPTLPEKNTLEKYIYSPTGFHLEIVPRGGETIVMNA